MAEYEYLRNIRTSDSELLSEPLLINMQQSGEQGWSNQLSS